MTAVSQDRGLTTFSIRNVRPADNGNATDTRGISGSARAEVYRWAVRVGPWVIVALVLAGLAWVVDRAPATTLGYVRALGWPLVILGVAVLFRRPLHALMH